MGINQDEMWNSSWNNKSSVRKNLMNFSPAEHLSSACCCGVRTRLFRSFGLWFLVCLFMTLGPMWWLKDGHSSSLLSWIVTKMESQLNRGDQHHLSCKVKCVVFILASNGTLTVIKKYISDLSGHPCDREEILYLLSMSAGEGLPETQVP